MVDVARRCAVEAALSITADCVQVHGALGFSWEHDAHLYLKRARRLAARRGGPNASRDAISDLMVEVAQGGAVELFPPIALANRMPA
jgi:alkylation response protein AidB-like acyl-CoA dehydrogenase